MLVRARTAFVLAREAVREREFRDPHALTGWTGIAKDVGKAVVPL
jgi:hypothetical protein